jgi:hypothetical protein
MNASAPRPLDCESSQRLIVLYVCDEASPEERGDVESHVAQCGECAAALSAELRLRQMLATMQQPADLLDQAGALLAQCRSELAEALDDSEDARREVISAWSIGSLFSKWRMQLAMHPALAATGFILIGLFAGKLLPGSQLPGTAESGIVPAPQVTVTAAPRITDQDLQNLSISGITPASDATTADPTYVVHLRAVRPLEIEGNASDVDMKRVLAYVISSGPKFDSGVRLDSVQVLRSQADDAGVRHVLCEAALKDPNASVRLNALEALQGDVEDSDVRDALVQVLTHDANPGVRIVAINQLRGAVESGRASDDAQLKEMLQSLSKHDSNGYVRVQAAAAVRHLDAAPQQP